VVPGEKLVAISGKQIRDVLDYMYFSPGENCVLQTLTGGGKTKLYQIVNPALEPLGITFDSYLMDSERGCANNCVFCFVDQLPKGMRDTLYFKDDDSRLSFLQGNYVTLTNLSEREISRIIDLKISPLYVSVHSTNDELRCRMLGNRHADGIVPLLKRLIDGGIELHCQIVVVPAYNNGTMLTQTLSDLPKGVGSVAVVPVGLTKHREGLPKLRPVTTHEAEDVINITESFRAEKRLPVWCADEFYLMADLPLPKYGSYGKFPQIENGVGLLRKLETAYKKNIRGKSIVPGAAAHISAATGTASAPFLRNLLKSSGVTVYAIENEFFGNTVTVAGLVTGGDLIAQLTGKLPKGQTLLIPSSMLRSGEDVFLDDVTVAQASERLGVNVIPVEPTGDALYKAIFQ
jgi:putative radical SAM enzyme (TIGR03279 family)